ncbi:MAG: rRNA maturation RNase YbeY [Oscillospiraceae bacterium]|nr:rRNA maturation RNase YbeY [Oscillospiraceae bacterium]
MSKLRVYLNNKSDFDKSVRTLIKKSCEAVIREENFDKDAEVSVLLTDADEVRRLNKNFRNKDKSTDVLSFPLGEINPETGLFVFEEINPETGFFMLGDIIINAELAKERAYEYGHSEMREIAFLTIHSMLHLLGYDHENDEEGEKTMREKQTQILEKIGLSCI